MGIRWRLWRHQRLSISPDNNNPSSSSASTSPGPELISSNEDDIKKEDVLKGPSTMLMKLAHTMGQSADANEAAVDTGAALRQMPSSAALKESQRNRGLPRVNTAKLFPADNESVEDINDIGRSGSVDNLSILSHSVLPQGRVSFWREFAYDTDGRPFVRVSHDTPMDEVSHILAYEWKMSLPSIVVVILSSMKQDINWAQHRQWENLQKGLIEAAKTTHMWIVTHGANCGIPLMLGNIARKEEERRKAMKCYRHPKQTASPYPKLTLIGITRDDVVTYEHMLDGKASKVEVENKGNCNGRYDLNPEHTHFFLVRDPTSDLSGIQHFVRNFEQYLLHSFADDGPDMGDEGCGRSIAQKAENPTISSSEIPVIGLLVGGGDKSTNMVLEHMKNETPVVVIKGSGGAADLLAFAYDEVKEKARGDWDPDYIENFVKSELSKKIAVAFPQYRDNNLARNKFRDRILECVRHSCKDECVFLTFLDIHSHTIDLSLLNQHLLRALFKATLQKEDGSMFWYEHMQKALYLTLDWNSSHIALSEVFDKNLSSMHKFKVEKKIFEAALLRADRESFVALFLNQGFQVHKFLSEKRFKRLFEKAESPEFFRTVCLEGALGYSFSLKLDKDFIKNDLNWLIKQLTKMKNFVDSQELTNHSMGIYSSIIDPLVAERKAQMLLALWAVLMNRPQLAKVLWKRADYPIHLALVISLMYSKLVAYVRETHLIKEMEDRSREFAEMAIGVLDSSFQQNNCRAFDILSEEIADWNYKTAVEIAADARNRHFIAHPCCQKWLTNMFFGDIRIRELKWGPIPLPVWVKVVLSAFFFFPMYIWVHFKMGQKRSIMGIFDSGGESEDLSDNESDDGTILQPPLSRKCSRAVRHSIPIAALGHSTKIFKNAWDKCDGDPQAKSKAAWNWKMPPVTFLQYFQPRPQPPFWKKISLLWNAPVTKFWTYQIFYILYLGLFSTAVLLPGCGNFYLDITVWSWTALLLLELIRKTFIQYRKYSSIPLVSQIVEIVLMCLFLSLYMIVRILATSNITLNHQVPFISPYAARAVLCFGLLYFYYRFIWIYLPISPTLGPLLFRIKLMVTVDFVHFLRLSLLFIISGGIVIHAVIYPDFPFGQELLRRVFHRAWFTLFYTPISDLEGEETCDSILKNKTDGTCHFVGKHSYVSCPRTGVMPYIMVIQYLIILKLILVTLLTALYSNTATRAVKDADAIWKFQRYHLVLDFNTRFRLPAPLNAISFILTFIEYICKFLTCQCCKKPQEIDKAELLKMQKLKVNDHNYWKGLAEEYSVKVEDREKEKDLPRKQMEGTRTILEDMEYHKFVLQQLKVRITELEKIMLSSKISLEEIRHDMGKEDSKVTEISVHLLSRQSPYPGTRVKRFPLADRYVPWEVLYSVYDPVVYSKPRAAFHPSIRDTVDEDLLMLREQQGTFFKMPNLKWNFVYTSGAGVNIDRRSWMEREEGEKIIYKLDSAGLPVNPMGRTGLRGRGNLCRWGPNHAIRLVITRWRHTDSFMQSVNMTEEQTELEFICTKDDEMSLFALPGGFMYGLPSLYEVVKKQFVAEPIADCWTSETMQEYFSHYARAPAGDFVDIVGENAEELNFEANILLRGYIDDNRNTDNAWIEAEVWHYHYTGPQCIADNNLPLLLRWKKVTSNLSAKMVPSHANLVLEVQRRLENIA